MSRSKERGATYVELALVAGLLSFLILSTMEIAIFFQKYESLSALSREGANAGLRACFGYRSSTKTEDCLKSEAVEPIVSYGRLVDQEVALIISVYQRNAVTGSISRVGVYPPEAKSNGHQSRFSESSFSSDSQALRLLLEKLSHLDAADGSVYHGRVVVSEAFFKHRPIAFNLGLDELYEVSIF